MVVARTDQWQSAATVSLPDRSGSAILIFLVRLRPWLRRATIARGTWNRG